MVPWIVLLYASTLAEAQTPSPLIERAYHATTMGNEISPGCAVVVEGAILDPRVVLPVFRTPLPYELAGVRVTVNEAPAPLLRVEASQVVFLAPDSPPGEVVVRVSNAVGTATTGMVMKTVSPGLVRDAQSADRVRVVRSDGNIGIAVRSGETVSVSATGLGVLPPAKLDLWPFGVTVDSGKVTLRVGGVAARITSMSVNDPGYYKIVFEMPTIGGVTFAPIVLELDGATSPAGLMVQVDPDTETRIYPLNPEYTFVTMAGTESASQSFFARSSPAGEAPTVEIEDAPWLVMERGQVRADARTLAPGLYEGRIKLSVDGTHRNVPVSLLVFEAKAPLIRRASMETVQRGSIVDLELYGSYLSNCERVEVTPSDGVQLFLRSAGVERVLLRLVVPASAPAGERRLRAIMRDGRGSNEVALKIVEAVETITLESILPAELLTGAATSVHYSGSIFEPGPFRAQIDPADGISVSNIIAIGTIRVIPFNPYEQRTITGRITVDESAAEGKRSISFVNRTGGSNSIPLYVRRASPELWGVWPRKVWPGRIYMDSGYGNARSAIAGIDLGSARPGGGEDIRIVPHRRQITMLTASGAELTEEITGFLQVSADAAPGMRQVRLPAPGTMSNEVAIEVVAPPAEAPQLLDVAIEERGAVLKGKVRFRDLDGDIASPAIGFGARLEAMVVEPVEASFNTRTSIPLHAPGVKEGSLDFAISLLSIESETGARVAFWIEDAAGNLSNVVVIQR